MPSRAKMMRKRKRSSSREAMDFMEFSSDATRLDRAVQWLTRQRVTSEEEQVRGEVCGHLVQVCFLTVSP